MRHTHGEGVLFLALLTGIVACSDPASRTVGLNVSSNVQSEPTPSSNNDERAALTKVARLTAMALDNEPARQHLKRDMRAAPFREHKLELVPYLRSTDGKALLSRMVSLSGGTETELFQAINAVRPLEFYMPVAKHRETWTGSADVLVASQLDESAPIVAFDETGTQVALGIAAPPEQPTLSIVPVETRFDRPMSPIQSRNVRDQNGAAIGTLEMAKPRGSNMVACDDICSGGGGGGGGTATIPPGLYLEYSRILDMKEPWVRGDPEIEVHIQGPTDLGNPKYGADLSCSGEHAYSYQKVFDQNDGFWSGRVLLFSDTEVASFNSKFTEGFDVIYWEDDNVPCAIRTDVNVLKSTLEATGRGSVGLATQLIKGTPWYVSAGIFLATAFSNSDWLLTNDDFVGIAVWQSNLGYTYSGNTHVIMDGTTLNGRATLVWH
jgi:hypothetical protein